MSFAQSQSLPLYMDSEKGGLDSHIFKFTEKSVRLGFVRRVYSIVAVQLLLTTAVVSVFLLTPSLKEYAVNRGEWIGTVSVVGSLAFLLVLTCSEKARRQWPTNIVCLGAFTVFEALYLGVNTARFDTEALLLAVGLTAFIVIGLTLFALQTKWDFTALGGILLVLLFGLLGFGVICLFLPGKVMVTMYSSAGAALFGLYIVFDTQLMLGGKHKYALSPEEYIFAALNLYLDIINLFLYLLSLIQSNRK